MGRPKGSKNKPKETPVPVIAEIVIPQYVPITAISLEEKRAIYNKVTDEGLKTCNYYGLDKWPEEAMAKRMNAILDAPDLEMAVLAKQKATDRLQIHLLSLWGKGAIWGPATFDNLESRAKKADSLATYLESIGNLEGADKQRERAERIRSECRPM
jgi:hypothetical protein